MRVALLLPLLALAGCATMRDAAGRYAAFADKGVELKAGSDNRPAADGTPPGGLAGDGKVHTYAEPTPRSS